MLRWHRPLGWILVWGFMLIVGGSILLAGYAGSLETAKKDHSEIAKSRITETTPVIGKDSAAQGSASKVSASKAAAQTLAKPGKLTEQTVAKESSNAAGSVVSNKPAPPPLTYQDFPCPVQGKVIRGIGSYYFEALKGYRYHSGEDIREPEGTVIRATHAGRVVFAGADPMLGQKVVLDCGQGWQVTYGSLDNLTVKVGQTVGQQEELGQVGFYPGLEGYENQTQLHYEVTAPSDK